MILDKQLMFADGMSLVGATGTYKCDRSVKIGEALQVIPPYAETGGPHDAGIGPPLRLLLKVIEAADSAGGTATVKAQIVMADDQNLATNPVILGSSEAIAEADLVDGYEFRAMAALPQGTTKNFLGVQFVTAGEALTAGKVTATVAPLDHDDAAFI